MGNSDCKAAISIESVYYGEIKFTVGFYKAFLKSLLYFYYYFN